MKFGFRTPSLKKSLSASLSPKRKIKNALGLRMPKGTGMITNPKKALYNKVYNKTSFGVSNVIKGTNSNGDFLKGFLILIGLVLILTNPFLLAVGLIGAGVFFIIKLQSKKKTTTLDNQQDFGNTDEIKNFGNETLNSRISKANKD